MSDARTVPPATGRAPGWTSSLAHGAAGIALLHIERARSGTASWDTAHRWAASMTASPVSVHPGTCGLFQGAPAVAFTLHAGQHPAYRTALVTLDRHIGQLTASRLHQAHERIIRGQPPDLREFDLISGLTGIGVYLLCRSTQPQLLRDVLAYLVRLTMPLRHDRHDRRTLPGWWTGNGPGDVPSPQWPAGHGNLGIAHGISGPLALMSLCASHGISVTGLNEAISRICSWTDTWRHGTGTRGWWPGLISAAEQHAGLARQAGPGPPSWCYGTPGIARAQALAGRALDQPARQQLARHALLGCVTDDDQLTQLSHMGLCHGWYGLIHGTQRAAAEADCQQLRTAARNLLIRQECVNARQAPDDGLLDGNAGIALVTHTIARGTPPTTRWDACLLLDG